MFQLTVGFSLCGLHGLFLCPLTVHLAFSFLFFFVCVCVLALHDMLPVSAYVARIYTVQTKEEINELGMTVLLLLFSF